MQMVSPRFSFKLSISRSNIPAETGSRPVVGSSKNNKLGSMARERARPARRLMPPDSSEGSFRPASGGSPVKLNFMAAIWSMNFSGRSVYSLSGTLIFSATVREENSAPP